jgi:hypothetical protein
LVRAACACYGVALWLYPAELRRTFGRELVITFRSRVEDVLDSGGIATWLAFVVHIAWDTMHATALLAAADDASRPVSLLGLGEGERARGGLPGASMDIHVLFVAAGLGLALGGWFAYFAVLPRYVS